MMWLMLPIILVFARHADCGALRCPEGTTCTAEEESKEKSPEELPSGVTCAPGSTWIDECNSCFCSDIGITYCSRVGCDSGKPPKLCAANTAWNKECNTCNCSDDGQPICTTTDCTAIKEKRSVELPSGEDCAPGTSWMNQCNSCSCGPTGIGYCTLMGCIGRESEPWTLCAENTSWKKGCNICNCKNGKPVCTERKCSTHKEKRSVELPEGEDCAPGTAWMNQCNRCACGPGGAGYCTLMGCPGRESEPWRHCAENSSWKKGCNICHCKDGKPVCTEKACSNHIEKRLVDLPTGEDCAPGSTWKNQCNSCSCSPTGYGMCTLRGCSSHNTEPRRLCAENTSWKNKCNTCTCHDGKPDCTKMECDSQKDTDALKIDHWQNDEVPRPIQRGFTIIITMIKRETKCKPHEEYKSDCNVCKCAESGIGFVCTQNECLESGTGNSDVEVFQETDGTDHIERHSVCQPNTVFYVSCNTCHCNRIGTDYSCTNMVCELPKDVEVFHELMVGRSAVNTTKQVICVANRMFIKDCNTCWCNEDGTSFYCTRRVCTIPDDQEEAQKGTQSSLSRKIRAVQEGPKQCQPGQEFRLDCNKCLCDNEGQNFSCTRMDCNALNNHNGDSYSSSRTKRETEKEQVKCVPGSVFDRGCNVCRCSDEGQHAICTMKKCRPNKEEGKPAEQDQGFRCNPGEQFAQECNDCTCSADGRSVFCTLRLCDKDISADI